MTRGGTGARPLTTSGMLTRVARPGLLSSTGGMSRSSSDFKYGLRVAGGGNGGLRNYGSLIRRNNGDQTGHARINKEVSQYTLQAKVAENISRDMLQCNTGSFIGRASHRHACGACSVPGVKPSKPFWKNQDTFLLMEKHAGIDGVSLIGVFDGHGPCGSEVSSFCRDNLSWVLQDCRVEVG